jgi:anti-sigma factor RsiW
MTSEELEFAISQYADGTLPNGEVAALEEILKKDASAQAMLREYRQLDHLLQDKLPPQPNEQWDRLQEYVSDVIDTEDTLRTPQALARLRWPARMAIAAAVLLAFGLSMVIISSNARHVPMVQVTGPTVEEARGDAVAHVEIGPSPALAERDQTWQYAEGLVQRPSRVTIASDVPKNVRPSY